MVIKIFRQFQILMSRDQSLKKFYGGFLRLGLKVPPKVVQNRAYLTFVLKYLKEVVLRFLLFLLHHLTYLLVFMADILSATPPKVRLGSNFLGPENLKAPLQR